MYFQYILCRVRNCRNSETLNIPSALCKGRRSNYKKKTNKPDLISIIVWINSNNKTQSTYHQLIYITFLYSTKSFRVFLLEDVFFFHPPRRSSECLGVRSMCVAWGCIERKRWRKLVSHKGGPLVVIDGAITPTSWSYII